MTGQELRTGPHNDAPRLHEVGEESCVTSTIHKGAHSELRACMRGYWNMATRFSAISVTTALLMWWQVRTVSSSLLM